MKIYTKLGIHFAVTSDFLNCSSVTLPKIPRYRAIADALINDIVKKKFSIGSALPAEAELCEQLKVSRHTVREGLRILEESGLIVRRQGSGSVVISEKPPVRYRQVVDSIEDLHQYGKESRFQLLKANETPASEVMAARLGCASGTFCIQLQALRSERGEHGEAGRPFALTHLYFPPQPSGRREKLLNLSSALPVLLALLDSRALGRVEQTFEAVALDAVTSAQLNVAKNSPSLRASRTYYDRKGKLIALAISLHRSDMFRYTTILKHESS